MSFHGNHPPNVILMSSWMDEGPSEILTTSLKRGKLSGYKWKNPLVQPFFIHHWTRQQSGQETLLQPKNFCWLIRNFRKVKLGKSLVLVHNYTEVRPIWKASPPDNKWHLSSVSPHLTAPLWYLITPALLSSFLASLHHYLSVLTWDIFSEHPNCLSVFYLL